ncbi:Domain of unknown function DUF1279 [Cinara cedri]|uniref:DUF1279 domain-containing protein n=1 Tax=Cinara cedri TaxID=506608 RepID=A0A5E4NIL3_9HEMI|nr:Domain of unknown function DUF1279 [Cinara cedri]
MHKMFFPKVNGSICRYLRGHSIHSYRFLSTPLKRQTPELSNVLTQPFVQYLPNLSITRMCHAKPTELTPSEKLKKAAKEYGSVLIVFHVGISLISLGSMYFFISTGVDVQQWIGWIGMSGADENTKIVAGASQFIIAYAIHKSLAPVRISITLVSVPLIVRYLRAKGIMKK